MSSQCDKCQAEYDATDAFCRKCGTPIIQDAEFTELANSKPAIKPSGQIEIITIDPTNQNLIVEDSKPVTPLTKQFGSKLIAALKTEQGQKLAKGAASLAVVVGVELINQAANRLTKDKTKGDLKKPTGVGDALIKAFEERIASENDEVVEETQVWERHYTKRTVHKRHK